MKLSVVWSILGGCALGLITGNVVALFVHSDTTVFFITLISALAGSFLITKIIDEIHLTRQEKHHD